MQKELKIAYLKLHIAIFLFGFTAILGRLISLDEGPLVWYRMLFTTISLLFFKRLYSSLKRLPKKLLFKICANGIVVMLHWITFYGAIKYSNVSVALCFLATASLFTAFLEPLILNKKLNITEVGLGLLILPGIYMVYMFSGFYLTGIILAIISAFLAAAFGIINKRFIETTDSLTITFLELGSGWLGLTILLPLYFYIKPESSLHLDFGYNLFYLLILSLLCTTLAFNFAVDALKQVSAFTSALSINLEPIYGILMAIIIFNEDEELSPYFYFGAFLILAAIFINAILQRRLRKKTTIS